LADLAIPTGDVIKEYDNRDLFPGRFPTLYPHGISGFENKDREVPLGFRSQAESYFDLPGHCFCDHRSFMFVALNIYQCQIAHLHTALMVKQAHFSEIVKRFVTLIPNHLLSI